MKLMYTIDMKNVKHIIFVLIIFSACTYTSSKQVKVNLNQKAKAIISTISKTYKFQKIDISGSEVTKNKKILPKILIVSILNGTGYNKNLKISAKAIASEIKSIVKDSTEFEKYRVSLISQKKDGLVTKSTTNDFEFNFTEI